MRNFFIIFLCLPFFLREIAAQITITSAVFPAGGDTLRYQLDDNPPALQLGIPGQGNQIWDFSHLHGNQIQETVFLPASTGSEAAQFPTADLRINASLSDTYYRKTNTVFENLGSAGADLLQIGISATLFYQPALPERRAPMNFFDVHTVESDLNWTVPTGDLLDTLVGQLGGLVDSFRFRIHTSRLDVIDAWGTCNIPNGTFPVLREKRTTITEIRIDVHTFLGWTDLGGLLGGGGSGLLENIGIDTNITYHFFSATEKEGIAVVTIQPGDNSIESVRFKYIPGAVTSSDIEYPKPRLLATPNPAHLSTTLTFEDFIPGNFFLKINDLPGKNLCEQQIQVQGAMSSFLLDLAALPQGWLFVRILDKNGRLVATQKLFNQP